MCANNLNKFFPKTFFLPVPYIKDFLTQGNGGIFLRIFSLVIAKERKRLRQSTVFTF